MNFSILTFYASSYQNQNNLAKCYIKIQTGHCKKGKVTTSNYSFQNIDNQQQANIEKN